MNNVIFVGNIPNVNDYLQAMDVFLMPSLFEGLPITGIEAQANGLPCIFADTITQELKITKQAEYCSLNESVAVWAMRVLAAADKGRKDCREELISNGYSIKDSEIVGVIVDIILNTLLIPRYASAGAAIGTLAAETAVFIVQYRGYMKKDRDSRFEVLRLISIFLIVLHHLVLHWRCSISI